jgi:HlyD family secretion protein
MPTNNFRYSLENLIVKNRVNGFSVYVFILFLLLIALFALPFIQVDVSAQARGILRSAQDPVPILSLVSGNIIQMNMRNNQSVRRGDTLLRIDSKRIDKELAHQISVFKQNQALLRDLHEMISSSEMPLLTQAILRQDFDKFLAQKKEAQTNIQAAKSVWVRQQKLFSDHVIPPAEYERAEHEYQMALAAWRLAEANQYAIWQRQFKEFHDLQQSNELAIQKLLLEKKQYVIRASMDGTLTHVKGFESNSFVVSAGFLAEIAPDHALLVECQVGPKDIGLLRIGQSARLQFDAFSYHQWGFVPAKVLEIDRNPEIKNEAVFFRVRCRLLLQKLQRKGAQVQGVPCCNYSWIEWILFSTR